MAVTAKFKREALLRVERCRLKAISAQCYLEPLIAQFVQESGLDQEGGRLEVSDPKYTAEIKQVYKQTRRKAQDAGVMEALPSLKEVTEHFADVSLDELDELYNQLIKVSYRRDQYGAMGRDKREQLKYVIVVLRAYTVVSSISEERLANLKSNFVDDVKKIRQLIEEEIDEGNDLQSFFDRENNKEYFAACYPLYFSGLLETFESDVEVKDKEFVQYVKLLFASTVCFYNCLRGYLYALDKLKEELDAKEVISA